MLNFSRKNNSPFRFDPGGSSVSRWDQVWGTSAKGTPELAQQYPPRRDMEALLTSPVFAQRSSQSDLLSQFDKIFWAIYNNKSRIV